MQTCAQLPYILILSDTLWYQTSGNIYKKGFQQGKHLVSAWAREYKLNDYFTSFLMNICQNEILWTPAFSVSLKCHFQGQGLHWIWASCKNIILHTLYLNSLISTPIFCIASAPYPSKESLSNYFWHFTLVLMLPKKTYLQIANNVSQITCSSVWLKSMSEPSLSF